MPEMSTAASAFHLVPDHAVAGVPMIIHDLLRNWLPEAGPASVRIKLRRRAKQLEAATGAVIIARCVVVPILARVGSLGALMAKDLVLVRSECLLPFRVRLHHLLDWHCVRLRLRGNDSRYRKHRNDCPRSEERRV